MWLVHFISTCTYSESLWVLSRSSTDPLCPLRRGTWGNCLQTKNINGLGFMVFGATVHPKAKKSPPYLPSILFSPKP